MIGLLVVLTEELRLCLIQAAERRRARDGGCRFAGRRVRCGCETVYPLEEGRCPTCTTPVEFAVPMYQTRALPWAQGSTS